MFDQGKKTVEDMQTALKPYSMEALMEKAQEMYQFVSKRD
jgi:hypothetical protein